MAECSDILLVQADQRCDHAPGLAEALAAQGLSLARSDEPFVTPDVPSRTRAVVVTDLIAPRCLRALREATSIGARTALLLDGLTEARNTFDNPRAPESFLRPAPVDLVLAGGLSDVRVLRAMGNDAVATGLPRVDAAFPEPLPLPDGPRVLVATANTPAFDAGGRSALLQALVELREAAEWARVPLLWRLTDGLDDALGVTSDRRSLREVLASVSAVVTTPSTLMLESMRAGRPTAVLHASSSPLWHAAAWVWQPVEGRSEGPASAIPGPPSGLQRWVDAPDRLLRQLARPTAEQLRRQDESLRWLDASAEGTPSADLVADALRCLLDRPASDEPRPVPRVERLPKPVPRAEGRTRVVSIVTFDDTPLGGVTSASQRLGRAFVEDPSHGFDHRTLLVAWDSPNAHKAERLLDAQTDLCVVDRTEPMHRILEHVRRAVERLEPEILIPNHGDPAWMVAQQLRFTGVRCVGSGLTDDGYYREMLLHREWDGAIAGSEAIAAWLQPLAGDRPFATVIRGVPSSPIPRPVPMQGPLELAYVGRVVQPQKRVMDLVPLARELSRRGVQARLHIVGEGAALPALRRALASEPMAGVEVVFHGWLTEDEVLAFYEGIDASVLMSDAEGTCMSMLGAMAFGVVPAMTRTESGVAAYVEDGVSGLLADVGDPVGMAERLAWLAQDRARIAAIGAEAHRRVTSVRTIEQLAAETAALLREVMGRPLGNSTSNSRPSAAGLTPLEPWRWADGATPDAEDEAAWARSWLEEAGCRSVGIGAFEAGDDAVFVPAGCCVPEGVPGGVTVVRSDTGDCRDELIPHARRLLLRGCSRIAVFGAGPHTQRRRGAFDDPSIPIVGVIDDDPPATGMLFGLPVVPVDRAIAELRPDGVILSSDNWESVLWDRTAPLRAAGVHVARIYTEDVIGDASAQAEARPVALSEA